MLFHQRKIEKAAFEFVFMTPEWQPEIFADIMRELNRGKHPLLQLVYI